MRENGRTMRTWLERLSAAALALLAAAWASAAAAGVTDPTVVLPEPPLPLPAPGAAYGDPAFGTRTVRLLDAKAAGYGVAVPEYSNLQAWNVDMSLLLLRAGGGHVVLDARTLATRATLDSSVQAVRWSPTSPDALYYLKVGDNRLYRYRVQAAVHETLRTFSEYVRFARDQSYEELSNDGRYIALAGIRADGAVEIFAYDVIDGVKRAPLVSPYAGNPADTLNWVAMAPSGRYVLVLWGPSGVNRYQGLEAFDRDMRYAGHVHAGYGHSDFTIGPDGTDYVVVDGANDAYTTLPGQMLVRARVPDGITYDASGKPDWAASIANGGQVPLLQMNARNDGAFGTHTSCRNIRLHGTANVWCVVSTEVQVDPTDPANGWIPFQGETFRVYLDSRVGAPHVERLSHHRSRIQAFSSDGCSNGDLYWAQPHATISPDGSRILFGSNWHRVCDPSDPSDPFLLVLGTKRPSPPARLRVE